MEKQACIALAVLLALVSCCVASSTPASPASAPGPSPSPRPPSPAGGGRDRGQAPAGIAPCPLFPPNNVWNMPIDTLPLDPHSADYIAAIGPDSGLHPDFGAGLWNDGPIGIPYTTVPGTQPPVTVTFDYEDESDPGPYPIPPDAPIEGGPNSDGDRHVLVVDVDACKLYEMWYAWPQPDGSWHAGSGAVFDLNSNALRPDTWTSADAAGLPILPGLVRYDEVAAGEIRHALRFTAAQTRAAHLWPARHDASNLTDPAVPPMGQRFRLRADFDLSGYSPEVQVILRALQKYGMFLADNGSNWYLSGVPDERWDNDTLVGELATVLGANFEAVDESACMLDPDSAAASCFPPAGHWVWLPLVRHGFPCGWGPWREIGRCRVDNAPGYTDDPATPGREQADEFLPIGGRAEAARENDDAVRAPPPGGAARYERVARLACSIRAGRALKVPR